jgi:hypothetical protein
MRAAPANYAARIFAQRFRFCWIFTRWRLIELHNAGQFPGTACLTHFSARDTQRGISRVSKRTRQSGSPPTVRPFGSLAPPSYGSGHNSHFSPLTSHFSRDEQALVLKPADIGLSSPPSILGEVSDWMGINTPGCSYSNLESSHDKRSRSDTNRPAAEV